DRARQVNAPCNDSHAETPTMTFEVVADQAGHRFLSGRQVVAGHGLDRRPGQNPPAAAPAHRIEVYLSAPADQRHQTTHFAALDIAGHKVTHTAEPRLGESSCAPRFAPSILSRLMLLTGLAQSPPAVRLSWRLASLKSRRSPRTPDVRVSTFFL